MAFAQYTIAPYSRLSKTKRGRGEGGPTIRQETYAQKNGTQVVKHGIRV